MTETAELACTYAALILHDDNVPITADKISALVSAAGITIQPFWPSLFARVLSTRNMEELLLSTGGGAAPAPAAVASSEADTKKEQPKEEKKKKEEPKEEEDEDMGLGLFD